MVEVACETARDAFSGVQAGAHARGGVSGDGRGVTVDSAPLVLDVSQSYALCGLQSRLVDEQAYVDVCVCVCVCVSTNWLVSPRSDCIHSDLFGGHAPAAISAVEQQTDANSFGGLLRE